MSNKVTHLSSRELSKHDVVKLIRKASNEEIRFLYSDHVKSRMKKRKITTKDLLNIFRTGQPESYPYFIPEYGTWECNIFGRSVGRQLRIGIAIQLMDPESKTYIVVITAINLDR